MNEPKLGEKLTINGVKLVAVEQTDLSCRKCFLYELPDSDMFCDKIKCICTERTDKRNIILVLDKEQ